MNKQELLRTVASKTNQPQRIVNAILTVALEEIVEAVSEGDRVRLIGFGTFEPRERQAREARNPKTGESMLVPATRVPGFSAGKEFKERVASDNQLPQAS